MREHDRVYTTVGFFLFLALTMAGVAGCFSVWAGEPGAVSGEEIVGPARVLDGDTLEVSGQRIRLEGIDAPELAQTCRTIRAHRWACGRRATMALDARIAGRRVRCLSHGRDRYNRVLGRCFLEGRDVNAWMVRQGLAWAFVKYSKSYFAEEAQARSERRGIWQAPTIPAWSFRSTRWRTANASARNDCKIKGNISRNGRLYHMPWSVYYERVKITPGRGERWFCNEAEAIAAGWRPASI